MDEIFKQYGGVIIAAIVIVALIGVAKVVVGDSIATQISTWIGSLTGAVNMSGI